MFEDQSLEYITSAIGTPPKPATPSVHEEPRTQATLAGLPISNPLVSEESTYVIDPSGTQRMSRAHLPDGIKRANEGQGYLGNSSTWSFSHWVFNTIKNHLGTSNFPEVQISFDANAYDVQWGSPQIPVLPNKDDLPSLDHALYLSNTVKFRICQMFDLFDEAEFMKELHEFYTEPSEKLRCSKMWCIKYFLIVAFGKAFLERSTKPTSPPGSTYFIQAMNLLPNSEDLYREPIIAIEILCMVSLYLQSSDMRRSAYSYVRKWLFYF